METFLGNRESSNVPHEGAGIRSIRIPDTKNVNRKVVSPKDLLKLRNFQKLKFVNEAEIHFDKIITEQYRGKKVSIFYDMKVLDEFILSELRIRYNEWLIEVKIENMNPSDTMVELVFLKNLKQISLL
jgi:hypothetical protein